MYRDRKEQGPFVRLNIITITPQLQNYIMKEIGKESAHNLKADVICWLNVISHIYV